MVISCPISRTSVTVTELGRPWQKTIFVYIKPATEEVLATTKQGRRHRKPDNAVV